MKKIKVVLLVLLVMAVPLFAFVGTVGATSFRSGDNIVVRKGEIIEHTLYIAGNNIEINGEIKGDVFCAGKNITVSAKVSGDVFCAGMNVHIGGTVEGDVRLAGQNITLSGSVSHNATLFGDTITIDESSTVGGDVLAAGSATTLNGQIMRDVDVAGDKVTINSMVGRNVTASTENLTLSQAANVAGDVLYYSNSDLQRVAGAQITGTVKKESPQEPQQSPQDSIAGSVMFFLMIAVLGLAVAALFPRMLHSVSENAFEKPGKTLLIGLVACIVTPVIIIGSIMTFVGILLGVVLLLAWLALLILSGVLFSYYLGRLVMQRVNNNTLLVMFVGVLMFIVLQLIPVINIITLIAATLFGSGMAVRELLKRTPKPMYETGESKAVTTHKKKQ